LRATFKAFYDIRVLALCLAYFANTSASLSLAFFLPQIIATMGTTPFQTGLLTAIPSLVGVAGLAAISIASDRSGNHRALLLAALLITGAGFYLAAQFGGAGASAIGIVALSFASIGVHGLKAPFWSLAPITLAGGAAAGGIAWINSVGNLGGFFGPSILGWLTDVFGNYLAGMYALAGLQIVVAILVAAVLRPAGAREKA
ncbi:MAG TPA: MFS transporter, partial [Rhizomicrobium sp.]|nr:MFS transporter [Rhizomicrobium sp.]